MAVADLCIIGTTPDAVGPLREIVGPIAVDDLEQTTTMLIQQGATITTAPTKAPTGTVMYARSPGGLLTEWLEYTPELVKRIISG